MAMPSNINFFHQDKNLVKQKCTYVLRTEFDYCCPLDCAIF